MWGNSKSLTLSIIVTRLLMVIIVLMVLLLPYIGRLYLELRGIRSELLFNLILPLYLCVIPAAVTLICLDRMLARIKKGDVFVHSNVRAIRYISWCCIIVAFITGVSSCFYLPFVFIMIVMGFCGLITRVIKNVFLKAVLIKNENDFTI